MDTVRHTPGVKLSNAVANSFCSAYRPVARFAAASYASPEMVTRRAAGSSGSGSSNICDGAIGCQMFSTVSSYLNPIDIVGSVYLYDVHKVCARPSNGNDKSTRKLMHMVRAYIQVNRTGSCMFWWRNSDDDHNVVDYLNLGTGATLKPLDPCSFVACAKDNQHILRDTQSHRFPEFVVVPARYSRTINHHYYYTIRARSGARVLCPPPSSTGKIMYVLGSRRCCFQC